jgi:catechol 2,3-dioxygenase-like lactoylglutathione lyase family enzyme
MDMKLELVVIPVADVDRAKTFYVETLGFTGDVDMSPAPGVRVVQVTPPASACSLGFGSGIPVYDAITSPIANLHLVVEDIEGTRAALIERGVDVGPISDVGGGVRYAGFTDPDGNGLLLQEMAWRRGATY